MDLRAVPPPDDGLLISAEIDTHLATVTLAGDIDLATASRFRDYVLDVIELQHEAVVLDMTRVGFIDSTGIGALVAIRRHARTHLTSIRIVPSRRVRAALQLAQLQAAFSIHPGLGDARHDGHDGA